jgi:3-oxoadipate enol-lactonase
VKRPSNRTLALGALAAAAGIAVGAAATRRRARVPFEHEPLLLPDGDERELVMDDGGRISLTDMGSTGETSGPPIVLIHGWVNERRVWSLVAQRLVDAGHHVIAYDQRGHGRSTIGSASCTIDRLGDDLYQVLEQLDLHDVVIAGHSMGGMATQAMLVRHPDAASRIRSVVLVATGAAGIGLPPFARALGELVTGWSGGDAFIARKGVGNGIVRAAFGRHPNPAHIAATREMLLDTPPATRRAFLGAMQEMDLRPGLPGIGVPCAVIVGSADTLTPPARGKHIASSIPGATIEVLPSCGHMLPFEAPDEVTHLIELAAKSA